MGIIYKAENLVNGKIYVGKTANSIEHRMNGHLRRASKENPKTYFHCAIKKYGNENFRFSVLEEVDDNTTLSNREKFYIQTLDSMAPNGYNLTSGGDGQVKGWKSPTKGKHFQTDESKAKIKAKRAFQVFSNETNLKRAISIQLSYDEGRHPTNKGIPSKRKGIPSGIEAWNKGMIGFRAGIPTWNKGLVGVKTNDKGKVAWNKDLTKDTDERVAKYSDSLRNSENLSVYKEGHVPWNLGVPTIHSPESNEQRSKTMKNKKKPPEVIENMRLAQQARRGKERLIAA